MPPEQRLVLELTAYLDESGTHSGSEAVAVAGFLSTAPKWVEFAAQWQMALNDFGLDYFHMNKFANMVAPYDTWSEQERRARLSRLLNIIKANAGASIGIVFQKKAFELLFPERATAICGGPYGLAASACMIDMAENLQEIEVEARVAYVFESGSEGARQMGRVFQANLKDQERREKLGLSSQRFENKRDFLPLQAADILAYELYKQTPKDLQLEDTPSRYPLRFLADIPHRWGFLDGYELRKFSDILSIRAALEDSGDLKKM